MPNQRVTVGRSCQVWSRLRSCSRTMVGITEISASVRCWPIRYGPPLCVIEGYAYLPENYRLLPGEALCLFTDGVTEAMNADNELYGKQRLFTVLKSSVGATDAIQIVNAVRDDVRAFVKDMERSDDLTILALRWNGGET